MHVVAGQYVVFMHVSTDLIGFAANLVQYLS